MYGHDPSSLGIESEGLRLGLSIDIIYRQLCAGVTRLVAWHGRGQQKQCRGVLHMSAWQHGNAVGRTLILHREKYFSSKNAPCHCEHVCQLILSLLGHSCLNDIRDIYHVKLFTAQCYASAVHAIIVCL